MSMFNRVVTTVSPHLRLLAEEVRTDEVSKAKFYGDLIEAGLKATYPKEYKALNESWKQHVKGCIDKGESSDFYRVPKHMQSIG